MCDRAQGRVIVSYLGSNIENDPILGRSKVEFVQEYLSCSYYDTTPKTLVVHLELDQDDNLTLKIGNVRLK